MDKPEFDIFISYASEDASVADSILKELTYYGLKVWLDKIVLNIGDSIRRSIDHGLNSSHYGIVILSQSYLRKQWTQKELDGLIAREVEESRKIILPIWHEITAKEIRKYSAPLSDKVAFRTSEDIKTIGAKIASLFNPSMAAKLLTSMEIERGFWYKELLYSIHVADNGVSWDFHTHANIVSTKNMLEGIAFSFTINDLQNGSFIDRIEGDGIQLENNSAVHPKGIERFFRFTNHLDLGQEKLITYIRNFKKMKSRSLKYYFLSRGIIHCQLLRIQISFNTPPKSISYFMGDPTMTHIFEEYPISFDSSNTSAIKTILFPDKMLSYGFRWEYEK